MTSLSMRDPSIPLTGTERGKMASFSVLDGIEEQVRMMVEDKGEIYIRSVDNRYGWVSVEWSDSSHVS